MNETKDLTSYLKHYGFFFPNAEIYQGLAKSWDCGPNGAELKRKLKDLWYRLDNLISAEEFASFLTQEDKQKFTILQNCPSCGQNKFTKPRQFNLLLSSDLQITNQEKKNLVYLRPETCQGIFINFAAIQRSTRKKLPFGVGQIGKSFRNEITLHHGIFRTREFEQMEFVGNKEKIKQVKLAHDELPHYAQKTTDLYFQYHFGEKAIPQVIEVSFGVERLMLALLTDAIIPLSKQLQERARQIYQELLTETDFSTTYEEASSIGKAYRRQDAIGTYYCLTVDFQTLEDGTITVRERDTGLVGGGYLIYRGKTKPTPQQAEQNEKQKDQLRRQIQLIKEEINSCRIKLEKSKNGEEVNWGKSIDERPKEIKFTHVDKETEQLQAEANRVWNEYCDLINKEINPNGQWEILTNALDKDPKVKERFDNLIKTFYRRVIEKKGLRYPEVDFRGFGHFYITRADLLNNSVEMGHTGPPAEEPTEYIGGKIVNLPMEINLNQVYLLNNGKIGMDELIIKFAENPDGSASYTPLDISFAKLTNTIAHELAHAVQSVLNLYDSIIIDTGQEKKSEIRSQCESSGLRDSKGNLLYPQ
ncbi:15227_t:CDS:2 [Entrophospora sp. SA101]|nr:15227_t:CDS:2 [Entrophospora sp. SA101]